jgi:(1->4)-alpha-D-glucan 1-alpha-D-glucosylmutase
MTISSPAVNRIPVATYRLQFNSQFSFGQATEVLRYLAELGITDAYASPLFLAAPQSAHGYDVCGYNRLNPELGSESEFENFASELRRLRMGLLLDMVPNHMGAHISNCWWKDVLKHGVDSKFSRFFDIDWSGGKVVLPVLGDRYGQVLARNELQLRFAEEEIFLSYFSSNFPLSSQTENELIAKASSRYGSAQSHQDIQKILAEINADRVALHSLIQKQHYRLCFWRLGTDLLNYRRFFDVTSLVSLRVEDQNVFEQSHQFLFGLLAKQQISGLRIDHPDGLADPKGYFARLQNAFRLLTGSSSKLYVVAEKILSEDERLPRDWAVEGTTGYDFLNYLNGVFIQSRNEDAFTQLYAECTGCRESYPQVAASSKRDVLRQLFRPEVQRLTRRLRHIADQTVEGIDFSSAELEDAIVEFATEFPLYRTYADANLSLEPVQEEDVRSAISRVMARSPEKGPVLRFLETLLCLQYDPEWSPALQSECAEFLFRFQQLTGPAAAKGLEDTAFYRFNRFISLNEVGGNPGRFGTSVEAFHDYNLYKIQNWPHSMLATATHDTKRGEDVRARLNVLSEIPAEWGAAVKQWKTLNASFKTVVQSQAAPSENREYFLYQTLVGSWTEDAQSNPERFRERIVQYLLKGLREAKTNTSWTSTNNDYENATTAFAERVLGSAEFLASFHPFQRPIAFFGVINSLAQVLLKICSPGVPDFYQGAELWDFNLVDPDNRRPADYKLRSALLAKVRSESANRPAYIQRLLRSPLDAEIKLFTIWAGLSFRSLHSDLLEKGDYTPVNATGPKAEHLCAFMRRTSERICLVAVPRFPYTLMDGVERFPLADIWAGTRLNVPQNIGRCHNIFTGEEIDDPSDTSALFRSFPVALCQRV